MDMHPASGLAHMLTNHHSWYTPLDYLRALLCCPANFRHGGLLSPHAARDRARAQRLALRSVDAGSLFGAFIALCGLSHLAMPLVMQTGSWRATLLIYVPMAVVSVGTVVVIRRERDLVVTVLDAIRKALAAERR